MHRNLLADRSILRPHQPRRPQIFQICGQSARKLCGKAFALCRMYWAPANCKCMEIGGWKWTMQENKIKTTSKYRWYFIIYNIILYINRMGTYRHASNPRGPRAWAWAPWALLRCIHSAMEYEIRYRWPRCQRTWTKSRPNKLIYNWRKNLKWSQ